MQKPFDMWYIFSEHLITQKLGRMEGPKTLLTIWKGFLRVINVLQPNISKSSGAGMPLRKIHHPEIHAYLDASELYTNARRRGCKMGKNTKNLNALLSFFASFAGRAAGMEESSPRTKSR